MALKDYDSRFGDYQNKYRVIYTHAACFSRGLLNINIHQQTTCEEGHPLCGKNQNGKSLQ